MELEREKKNVETFFIKVFIPIDQHGLLPKLTIRSSTHRELFIFCAVVILEIAFQRNPTRIVLSKFICTLE